MIYKQILLLLQFILLSTSMMAQSFTEVTGTPFIGVFSGDNTFLDIDGDGDQDVLVNGLNGSDYLANLYTNDGLGNFIEVTDTPFIGFAAGDAKAVDVDGDGDLDLFCIGRAGSATSAEIALLFINDGAGNFTKNTSNSFKALTNSSAAFLDFDADGDEDLIIAGLSQQSSFSSRVVQYRNDGLGNFTEVTGTSFISVTNASIDVSDIENDGDIDILIAGKNSDNLKISTLYLNNGTGDFTESSGGIIEGLDNGSITFADIDGDGDEDFLLTGSNNSFSKGTLLYTNDGTGSFSLVYITPFEQVSLSDASFSDIDIDGDLDIIISGEINNVDQITKLYTNDGAGNFVENLETILSAGEGSSVDFADVNNDGYEDVLISGRGDGFSTILYFNSTLTSSKETQLDKRSRVSLYPNPVIDGNLFIEFNMNEGMTDIDISILDIKGSRINNKVVTTSSGLNKIPFQIRGLATGIYFVKIVDNARIIAVDRFVVK